MAQRKKRARRTDPDIVREIEELVLDGDGWSGPKIQEKLSLDDRFKSRTPSLRTIQNVMREIRPPVGPDEWWTLADADPDEARLVLPVLAELLRRAVERDRVLESSGKARGGATEGGLRIAAALARWIAHLRAIAPDMPVYTAYRMASRYWMAEGSGASTKFLDAAMALETWRGDATERGAVAAGLLPRNWHYAGPPAEGGD